MGWAGAGQGGGVGSGGWEPVFPAAVSWAERPVGWVTARAHTHTHTRSLSSSLCLGGPCRPIGPGGLSAGGDRGPQGQQEMGRRVGSSRPPQAGGGERL